MTHLRAALIALLICAAAGCATRPMLPDSGIDWDARARQLAGADTWQARGRIAVKSDNDGGQGNLRWTQAGADTRVRLSGPFGAGAYEIAWDDDRIVVSSKKGERVADYAGRDAADRFLESQLGWSFPARSIRYWLLGIADPEFDSRQRFDDGGWLSEIDQNGWTVTYSRFEQVADAYLPGKIVMESERARVRLVVDQWSF
ncbi:MAG: lipoprotein insertase outer membrane protein LolB [Gammaproteobacteria bacterium]